MENIEQTNDVDLNDTSNETRVVLPDVIPFDMAGNVTVTEHYHEVITPNKIIDDPQQTINFSNIKPLMNATYVKNIEENLLELSQTQQPRVFLSDDLETADENIFL
jgi:hypothetical protein